MTTRQHNDERLAEIGRLLDSHGPDVDRWPAQAVCRLDEVSQELPREVGMLRTEAVALARVLDQAPRTSAAAQSRLADRILAAALAGSGRDGATDNVVPISQARPRPRTLPINERRPRWREVATLMAACLLAGIILGGSLQIDPLLLDVADAVGLPTDLSTTTALADDTGEEDAL